VCNLIFRARSKVLVSLISILIFIKVTLSELKKSNFLFKESAIKFKIATSF